jgi:hypothetical protein
MSLISARRAFAIFLGPFGSAAILGTRYMGTGSGFPTVY